MPATIDRAFGCSESGRTPWSRSRPTPNGAIDLDALAPALDGASGSPTIVCLQAGNVSTGACDDLAAACERRAGSGAWVHVDGAFGLWAAASQSKRHLVAGRARRLLGGWTETSG